MDNLQLYVIESPHEKPSKLAWTSEKQSIIIRPLKKVTCDGFIIIFAHGRWPEDVADVSINITAKEENMRELGTLTSLSRALYCDFSDKGLQDVIKSVKLVVKPNYRRETTSLMETSAIKRIQNQHSKVRQKPGLTSPCVQGKKDDQKHTYTSSLSSSSSCKKRKKSSDSETPETNPLREGGTVPASRRLRLSEDVKKSETPTRNRRSLSKISPAAGCTEDKPSERWGHAMCAIGPDTMMLVGGQGAGQVISKDALWELNSETSAWSVPEVEQLASRPELRTGHTVTYDHVLNLVYVYGGSKNVRWYNDMFVLNLSDKKWSYIEAKGNAPTRAYHTSTFFRGEMFVFGGIYPNPNLQPDSCSNDLFIFSSVSKNWYQPLVLGPKPKPRSGHSATLLRDKLVIFGGWDAPVCFNDVHILDLGLMEFSSPVVEGKAPSPRSWHASCVLSDNQVLIHGGYDGFQALSDAFVFSLDTLTWRQVTLEGSGPIGARAGHTICAIPDGIDEGAVTDKIVMFGGGDNEDNFFNDLQFVTVP